jgi:hypothetical protein
MRHSNDLVREAMETLITQGFAPAISNGGKHIKVRWFDHGRRYTLIVSVSPGDRRARLNSRAVLRRLLRTNGTYV